MKPRNKRQRLVCELSESLPALAKKLEPWAFKNCIDHIGYRNKMWTSCLNCGDVWPTTSLRIKTEVCPGCGWKLKLQTTRKQKSRHEARFAVLDVRGEFQIVRYFDIKCDLRSGQKPSIYTREIMQKWILEGGDYEIISRQVGGMGLSYDHFIGEMTLKDKTYNSWKYDTIVYKIYPEMNLLPVYKRNGFTADLKEIEPRFLLRALPTDSKAETLLKAKQYSLLKAHLGDRSNSSWRYWSSIKICIRNKYIVKDAITWLDYLDLLHYFRKDLHSPKYVCPANIKKEHDRLVKKKMEIVKRQELEKKMKSIENDQKLYEQLKAGFFGIVFCENEIEVKVLEHVQEFIEEAEAHKHCVYSNRYFEKEDSLILSARVKGKPMETIEISLSKMSIVQSRGLQNKATDYHDQIVEVVNKHMGDIRKRTKDLKQIAA